MPVDVKDIKPAIVAVVIFTVADAFLHKLLENIGIFQGVDVVGQQYYVNKLIFGTLIVLGILWLWVRHGYPSFGLSRMSFLVVSSVLLLQTRYLYGSYSPLFHLIFIPAHAVSLYYGLRYAGVRF